jgi:hypothetical protein
MASSVSLRPTITSTVDAGADRKGAPPGAAAEAVGSEADGSEADGSEADAVAEDAGAEDAGAQDAALVDAAVVDTAAGDAAPEGDEGVSRATCQTMNTAPTSAAHSATRVVGTPDRVSNFAANDFAANNFAAQRLSDRTIQILAAKIVRLSGAPPPVNERARRGDGARAGVKQMRPSAGSARDASCRR